MRILKIAIPFLLLAFCSMALKADNIVKQVMLEQHNMERESLDLVPLEWSDELAESAQLWADTLSVLDKAQHSDSGYGENIWFGSYQSMTLEEMATEWLNEKQFFRVGEPVPKNCSESWQKCGHYSQMVWASTTQIGCGVASSEKTSYLVCQYNPAGNILDLAAY